LLAAAHNRRDRSYQPTEKRLIVTNMRMTIAVGATVLGLGGLAGYALGSNSQPTESVAATPVAAKVKPKVRKQVVHHTIHVRRKPKATEVSGAGTPATAGQSSSAAPPSPAPAPAASAPAPAPAPAAVPVSNTSAPAPVSTGTSGSGGSGSSASSGDDGGGEYSGGGESESEGGGDD